MAVLGIGMGLMISQLGNVVQSSVDESGRSEAGGLQYTGQQLGSSLGVALIGAIVLIGLTSTFISNVEHDPRISAEVAAQVGVAAGYNTNFVSSTRSRPQPRRPASTRRPLWHWWRIMSPRSSARSKPGSLPPRFLPSSRWALPGSYRTSDQFGGETVSG